jgi:hypothetical protein
MRTGLIHTSRTCANCAFVGREINCDDRECRRRAPVVVFREYSQDLRGDRTAAWPLVKSSDWCGEWAAAAMAPQQPQSPKE